MLLTRGVWRFLNALLISLPCTPRATDHKSFCRDRRSSCPLVDRGQEGRAAYVLVDWPTIKCPIRTKLD